MYGNPAFECGGAQVRTVCRQLATVVTVQGVVDDTNIERITALAVRSIIAEKAFVLDLSGVDYFSAHELSLLSAVDEHCFRSDVEWLLDRERTGAARDFRAELPGRRLGAGCATPFRGQHRRAPSSAAPSDHAKRVARKDDIVLLDIRWLGFLIGRRHPAAKRVPAQAAR